MTLRKRCVENNFSFISNANITPDYLWTDGLHLQDRGTEVLLLNITSMLNHQILNNSFFWQVEYHLDLTISNESDIEGLIDLRKKNPDNPMIGYLNVNSLSGKIEKIYWQGPLLIFFV